MPCIPSPDVPLPALPNGITLTPPNILGKPRFGGFCCSLLAFDPPIPPLPLDPITVNPAFIKTARFYLQKVAEYRDAIVPRCPKD